MHIAIEDPGLEHLWVLYPGDQKYALDDKITAISLKEIIQRPLNDVSPGGSGREKAASGKLAKWVSLISEARRCRSARRVKSKRRQIA